MGTREPGDAEQFMDSPVSDSDRLEAIFEQVASIRNILMFWSILYGIGLAVLVISVFVEVS